MRTRNTVEVTPYSKLYTCKNNVMQEVARPYCPDCARFKPFYTKRSNGSYQQVADDLGYCSMRGYRNIADLRACTFEVADCKNFVPSDPAIFKQVWVMTPPN